MTLTLSMRRRDLEPDLSEMLADPTMRLLMERDGVQIDDLTDFLTLVRTRLLAARWRRTA